MRRFITRIVPGKRVVLALLGVLIFSSIFSASFTFFQSFISIARGYVNPESDVYVIYSPDASTIFSGTVPIYISESLKDTPGVEHTCPELLSATVINGKPVTLRGVTDQFFEIHDLIPQGGMLQLNGNLCIIGSGVKQKLGLSVGETLLIRSTRRNSISEFQVSGVFHSGSPLDDEVLCSLDSARIFDGVSQYHVTLMEVSLDESLLSPEELEALIGQHHMLTVEVIPDGVEHADVAVKVVNSDGRVIENRVVSAPGEIQFSLPFGEYTVKSENQAESVVLHSDVSLSLNVMPGKRSLKVNVFNGTLGTPISGVSVTVKHHADSQGETTDERGEAVFHVEPGLQTVEIDYNGYRVVKSVRVDDNEQISINLNRVNLGVYVLNTTSNEPIEGAEVIVKSDYDEYREETDSEGLAILAVKPGRYVLLSPALSLNPRFIEVYNNLTTSLSSTEENLFSLTVPVMWTNGTIISGAVVELESEDLVFRSHTSSLGLAYFYEIPEEEYRVSVEYRGMVHESSVYLGSNQIEDVQFASTISITIEDSHPTWIRYIPESVAIQLSGAVFDKSMEFITDLIRAALLALATFISIAAVLSTWEIITSAVDESSKIVGVLRAIGADRLQSSTLVTLPLIGSSIIAGGTGYLLGYGFNVLLTRLGLFSIGGYSFTPSFSPILLLATVMLSGVVTLVASILSVRHHVTASPMALLRGLKSHEVIRFPKELHLKSLALTFLLPFVIRLLPDLLQPGFPVGFDTLSSYIPALRALETGLENSFLEFYVQRPFFWALASLPIPFQNMPFKIFPAIMHGVLGVSSYLFAKRVFDAEWKAVSASLLSTVYFVSLRVSWDLLANEMGLIFVFLCFTVFHESEESSSKTAGAFLLAIATVYTHEGASIILFVSLLPYLFSALLKRKWSTSAKYAFSVLLPLGIFMYRLMVIDFPLISSPLFDAGYPSGSQLQLARSVVVLFLYSNMILLPLALIGLRGSVKKPFLVSWLLSTLFAGFSPAFSPTLAFSFWQRWIFYTAFPLIFFAVEGMGPMNIITSDTDKTSFWALPRLGLVLAFVVAVASTSIGFAVGPTGEPFMFFNLYKSEDSWILRYVPPSMQYGSLHPFVAEDLIQCVEWLNANGTTGVVIADIEFRGYVSLYLDEAKMQWVNLDSSAYNDKNWHLHASTLGEDLAGKGLTVYLLGFWDILPKGFIEIHNDGYASVYKYKLGSDL